MHIQVKHQAMAAEALVAKHPCLREAVSVTGWNGWKNSIKLKIGSTTEQDEVGWMSGGHCKCWKNK